MKPRVVVDGVSWVGAIDWDRELFDALIPLPEGTTYNAYLVEGSEKTALVDTVDPRTAAELDAFLDGVDTLDYVVANHAEQDHAGQIGAVLDRYPDATLLCTPKCKGLLVDELHIEEARVQAVDDGETVSLGDRTLEFLHMPWVHWPETMTTYLREDNLLFSCDFFGSHLATSDLFVQDERMQYEPTKRYFAEIMMPFRSLIRKHLERLDDYEIDVICPSHGPLYDRPQLVTDWYREWSDESTQNLVLIPWISMHGSTRSMVNHLAGALIDRGVRVAPFDLAVADLGRIATELVDATTVVIATPAMMIGPHPKVAYATFVVNALRPKAKFATVVGSYGWANKVVETLTGMLTAFKPELLEPVLIKGAPREQDLASLDKLADAIAEKHREAGLL